MIIQFSDPFFLFDSLRTVIAIWHLYPAHCILRGSRSCWRLHHTQHIRLQEGEKRWLDVVCACKWGHFLSTSILTILYLEDEIVFWHFLFQSFYSEFMQIFVAFDRYIERRIMNRIAILVNFSVKCGQRISFLVWTLFVSNDKSADGRRWNFSLVLNVQTIFHFWALKNNIKRSVIHICSKCSVGFTISNHEYSLTINKIYHNIETDQQRSIFPLPNQFKLNLMNKLRNATILQVTQSIESSIIIKLIAT